MNSKGQLFSLDFIIAVALIMLAIGLLYKQAELFQYSQKDDTIQSELYRIGYNASNQLVGNPAITCKLVDDSSQNPGVDPLIIDYLPNCLPKQKKAVLNPGVGIPPGQRKKLILSITKERLGIPEGFKCKLSSQNHVLGAGCSDSPINVANIFSIDRTVVFLKDDGTSMISKKDFDDCTKGLSSCGLEYETINLQVWKA